MSFGGGDNDYGQEKYDAEMAKAAQMNAETAKQAQDFSEQFFADYIAPALESMTAATTANEERTADLFDFQFDQAKLQDERYRQYGIPAEDKFFKMAEEFSAPEYAEKQATAALGDQKAAQANQRGAIDRALASRGVAGDSPAAVAAMIDASVMGGLAEASAVNKARTAARDLGMAVTSDAANFGRGGLSGGLSYSQAAGGSAGQNQAVAQGGLGATSGAAAVPMGGYQTAIGAYSSNANLYGNMTSTAMKAAASESAANSAGMGQMMGAIGGTALKVAFSDRRLKQNIVWRGQLANGINLYEYDFVWGGPRTIGVMADEVEKILPAAVSEAFGYKMVDYSMLEGF